jgi:hypothetical protein
MMTFSQTMAQEIKQVDYSLNSLDMLRSFFITNLKARGLNEDAYPNVEGRIRTCPSGDQELRRLAEERKEEVDVKVSMFTRSEEISQLATPGAWFEGITIDKWLKLFLSLPT